MFLFPLSFFYAQKVIDNDRGVHMRPMPGMIGLTASGSKVFIFLLLTISVAYMLLLYC